MTGIQPDAIKLRAWRKLFINLYASPAIAGELEQAQDQTQLTVDDYTRIGQQLIEFAQSLNEPEVNWQIEGF